MKISVCIPLYNGENCIEGALQSLVNQTRKPDEVIIRDDCSSDEGVKLFSKYQNLNIDLSINEQNLGMIGNWNECLKCSSGDIVTFLHQDDGYESNFLFELEKDLLKDENIGMWVSQTYVKGNPLKDHELNTEVDFSQDLLKKIYTWEYIPAPTAVCFKKNALEDVGFYDEEYKYVAEPDLYFRLVSKGYLVHRSSKTLVWRGLPKTRATASAGGSNLYYNEWLYFLEKFSFSNVLINKEMQSNAFNNFYQQSTYSAVSQFFNLNFRESFLIVKTIFSRGRGFKKNIEQKHINHFGFLLLVLKSSVTIFYYFLRHNAALMYRSFRKKTYN